MLRERKELFYLIHCLQSDIYMFLFTVTVLWGELQWCYSCCTSNKTYILNVPIINKFFFKEIHNKTMQEFLILKTMLN